MKKTFITLFFLTSLTASATALTPQAALMIGTKIGLKLFEAPITYLNADYPDYALDSLRDGFALLRANFKATPCTKSLSEAFDLIKEKNYKDAKAKIQEAQGMFYSQAKDENVENPQAQCLILL